MSLGEERSPRREEPGAVGAPEPGDKLRRPRDGVMRSWRRPCVRCSILFKQGRARGLGGSLRDGAGDLLPAAPEEALDVVVDEDLGVRERGVDLVLVCGEEGAELGVVEPGGAGGLREGEVEEEKGFDGVV